MSVIYKIASRTAQYVLAAEFVFNYNDKSLDAVTGGVKTYGAVFGDNIVFDAIPLPLGAVVINGSLIVDVAGVGPAPYTVSVGSAANPTDLLAATDLTVKGRTPLTGLGLAHNDGSNVRITINSAAANATAGKFRICVEYTIDGRTNEVQIT